MSSRQEEKERRKAERLERERAEAAAAKRKRLVATVAGGLAAAAAIAVLVFVVIGGGDDNDPDGPSTAISGGAPIPAQQISDLDDAAKAAGCAVREFPDEGAEHTEGARKPSDYKTNPPTSGNHNITPAQDGLYTAGSEPAIENWVHTLEHGRILLQYKPGTPKLVVDQLQTLFNEPVKGGPDGYHMVLMRNNTLMKYQVAAVAWRKYVVCNQVNDKTWDALRAFRDMHVDTAPEQVP